MDIVNIVLKLIGLIIIAVGVVMTFDARSIAEKRFSFGDRNSSVKTLKIIGAVVSIIGGLIVILNV